MRDRYVCGLFGYRFCCWLLVFMSSFSVLSAFSFLLDGYNEHYTIVYTYNLLSMAWK